MRYVISDIHGHYELFVALMRKIGFSKNDELFICGDVIDKGTGAVKLLHSIASNPNMRMIRGNHEELFLKYYASLMRDTENYGAVLEGLKEYLGGDGELLTWELVDYLESLPYYIEEDDFICVHAGVPLLENGEIPPLDTVDNEELLYNRRFKNADVLPKGSKTVFFGHTSLDTPKIALYTRREKPRGIGDCIKIHLDLGTVTTGVLGCFCVDNCSAYYVEKRKLNGGTLDV